MSGAIIIPPFKQTGTTIAPRIDGQDFILTDTSGNNHFVLSKAFTPSNSPGTIDGFGIVDSANFGTVFFGGVDVGGGAILDLVHVMVGTTSVGGQVGLGNNAGEDIATFNSGLGITLGDSTSDTATGLFYRILDGAGGTRFALEGATGNITQVGTVNIGATIAITGMIDDDTMATASATTVATSESIKDYVDNNSGGTLDQAYDFGGAGAGRTITIDSGEFQLNASAATEAFLVRDTTGAVNAFQVRGNGHIYVNYQGGANEVLQLNNAGANNLPHILLTGTSVAPTTPPSGSFWFNSTSDRLGVETGSGSEDVAYVSDITLDDAYNGGSTITADAGAVTFTVPNASNNQAIVINQNDSTNNPDAFLINNAGTGNDIVGSNFQVSKAGEVDGSGFAVAGTPGLTNTYTFGGGGTGDIASMTFDGGILTGVTLVP